MMKEDTLRMRPRNSGGIFSWTRAIKREEKKGAARSHRRAYCTTEPVMRDRTRPIRMV